MSFQNISSKQKYPIETNNKLFAHFFFQDSPKITHELLRLRKNIFFSFDNQKNISEDRDRCDHNFTSAFQVEHDRAPPNLSHKIHSSN